MIRWFAKNDIATNIIMLAILLGGLFVTFYKLPVEVSPTYTMEQVRVRISAPGLSPEEIETKIVIPIENTLHSISGVDEVSADVKPGNTFFFITAEDGADMEKLKQEVESRINRVPSLPSESDKPRIFVPDSSYWKEVITIVVSGNLSTKELETAAIQIRDDLMATPGVSRAVIQGKKRRELSIEPSLESLQAYGLTLSDISQAVRNNSVDTTAGSVTVGGKPLQIRSAQQRYSKEEFGEIFIKRVNGADIRIKDVAAVRDNYDNEENKIILFNGKPCIQIEVFRTGDESALAVSDIVHEYVKKDHPNLPEGVNIDIWDDDSIPLRSRIDTLTKNLVQGAVLVLIMLTLFLRPALAFWVVLGVPISFAGGAILMYHLGVSINLWTLFGFIIVLGIVVDDAIVTAENIYSKHKDGYNSLDAAVIGTKEVATPVTFGVVTTIVAFIPLLYFTGWQGNIAKQIPLVIIPVLIFSLIESKFILPAHMKHLKVGRNPSKWNILAHTQRAIAAGLELTIQKIYRPLLKTSLYFRYAVVALFIAAMLVTIGYIKSDAFKMEDLPKVDRYQIQARLLMPEDIALEDTHERVEKIISVLPQLREEFMDGDTGKSIIGGVLYATGGHPYSSRTEQNKAYAYLHITPPSQRSEPGASNLEISERWRELVGEIEGAKQFSVTGQQSSGGRGHKDNEDIEIEIRGVNEAAKEKIADALQAWLRQQEYIRSAWTNKEKLRKELMVKLRPEGRDKGLTQSSLARQMRSAFFGEQAQRFQHGEDDVRVYVRLPEEERKSIHTLNTLRINLPRGESTAFKNVAEITESTTRPSIKRVERSRIFTVVAGLDPEYKGKLDNIILPEIEAKIAELRDGVEGTSWRYVGSIASRKEMKQRMLIGLAALLFTLFSLLAIPFKSVLQPIFVLLAVPVGVIGALLGHMIMGFTPSYLSIFGILALCGVVVNDSLVMVDFINQKRKEGVKVDLAVIHSGTKRFRAIMLTSITTFAGLLPIIFERSIESQFLKPMAISLGFGILFATVITLFLIPCAYLVTEDLIRGLKWFFGVKQTDEKESTQSQIEPKKEEPASTEA